MGLPRPSLSDEYFTPQRPFFDLGEPMSQAKRRWGSLPRLRRVSTSGELDRLVDEFMTCGYDLAARDETSALLRSRSWGSPDGHLIWAIATGWWTFGIGNCLYALYSHFTAEQIMIELDRC